jgi:hypothetical protein
LLLSFVIDHRVAEAINVAACFPDGGVHKYGRIDTHNIIVHLHHGFPPVGFNVVF